MEEKKNIIEIKDLHVTYLTDDALIYAVNGVNLEIKKGEVLGLVGETGAGKTTTARSIIQLLPDRVGEITQGSIVFDGEELVNVKPGEKQNRLKKRMQDKELEEKMLDIRGRRISMIFQDPMTSLNPVLTIEDQLAEVFLMHNEDNLNKEQIAQKVEETLKLVEIAPERKTEYPHQFSGGMKQRVVIAMALACRPELLLADEPTTALDVTIQAQVLQMMKNLQRELGTSVLLITHDLGVVAQMCNRVAVMYGGEIVELGTAEQIYDRSLAHHPYTVGLFNTIPDINMDDKRLEPIPGLMPDPSIVMEGCPFAERCPRCMEICNHKKPATVTVDGHDVKCHLFGKEAADGRNAD